MVTIDIYDDVNTPQISLIGHTKDWAMNKTEILI